MSTNPDFDFPMSRSFAEYINGPRVASGVCKGGGGEESGISIAQLESRISRIETALIVHNYKLNCARTDIRFLAGLEVQDGL